MKSAILVKQDEYFQVPNAIFDDGHAAHMGPYHLAVYLYLTRLANATGVAFPKVDQIARVTGMSRRKVYDALRWLMRHGYLQKFLQSGTRTRTYVLNPLPEHPSSTIMVHPSRDPDHHKRASHAPHGAPRAHDGASHAPLVENSSVSLSSSQGHFPAPPRSPIKNNIKRTNYKNIYSYPPGQKRKTKTPARGGWPTAGEAGGRRSAKHMEYEDFRRQVIAIMRQRGWHAGIVYELVKAFSQQYGYYFTRLISLPEGYRRKFLEFLQQPHTGGQAWAASMA